MKVVGLITEYNPFHNGHKYHIEQAKYLTGADYAVVVMSGNYVQRGGPSIVDKYTRTQMALRCGADLVFELPVSYATASAEYFALGAIKILDSLGFVDSICFGSECGNIHLLESIADVIIEEPENYKILLNRYVKEGSSYPAARSKALLSYFSALDLPDKTHKEIAEALASPNNILGIEYIKAIKMLDSRLQPATIKRICSSYHENELTGRISSASSIRRYICEDGTLEALSDTMPEEAYELFADALNTKGPVFENDYSSLLYYKLLYHSKEDLMEYLDVNEDIASRMIKLFPCYTTISDFAEQLKTKNLTHARINRILFHILLDIKKDLFAAKKEQHAIYLRLLGMRKDASFLIKSSRIEPKEPIITKLASAKSVLSEEAFAHLQLEVSASALYNRMILEKGHFPMKDEYRHGIIIQP